MSSELFRLEEDDHLAVVDLSSCWYGGRQPRPWCAYNSIATCSHQQGCVNVERPYKPPARQRSKRRTRVLAEDLDLWWAISGKHHWGELGIALEALLDGNKVWRELLAASARQPRVLRLSDTGVLTDTRRECYRCGVSGVYGFSHGMKLCDACKGATCSSWTFKTAAWREWIARWEPRWNKLQGRALGIRLGKQTAPQRRRRVKPRKSKRHPADGLGRLGE